jgi:lambda family phage portal protein
MGSVLDRVGNALDRAIGLCSPKRELQRQVARIQAKALRERMYAAAKSTRMTGSWSPVNQNVNDIIGASALNLRARVRQLIRDFPYFGRAVNLLTNYTVGDGMIYQARVKGPDGRLSKTFNQRIEDAFRWWADEADLGGKLHFAEIQRLAKRQEVEVGEYVVILTESRDRNRYLPLALQAIEPDWLVGWLDDQGGKPGSFTEIKQGVEFEKETGRVLAYHFTQPWASTVGPGNAERFGRTVRIPAERVIHGFDTLRPGQLRGVSIFAAAVLSAHDLSEYMDSELGAAKMASRWLAMVETSDPVNFQAVRAGQNPQNGSQKIEEIENAVIEYLRPGEKIVIASSNRPGSNFEPFVKFLLRMLAITTGVSYELLAGDYAELSYSSLRGVRNDLVQEFLPLQGRFRRQFCSRIQRAFLDSAVLHGRLSLPNYWQNPWPYLAAFWQGPGIEPVDPLREGKADADRIDKLLMSPQECAARRGRDYEEILDELVEAKRMQEERKLEPQGTSTNLKNNPAAVAEEG